MCNGLDSRNGLGSVRDCLAARMLACPHMAIASHLFAARHFGSAHLRIRQARERGGTDPETNQRQRDDGSESSHCLKSYRLLAVA